MIHICASPLCPDHVIHQLCLCPATKQKKVSVATSGKIPFVVNKRASSVKAAGIGIQQAAI